MKRYELLIYSAVVVIVMLAVAVVGWLWDAVAGMR